MFRALLAVVALVGLTGVAAGQGEADIKKPGLTRDELRYDGKPFSYWQTFPRTELKPERRVDAVRAMAAFGARGYAREAAAVIVELLKEYDEDSAAFNFVGAEPAKITPDQRVIQESLWALRKIGPDAAVVMLAHLDSQAVHTAALSLYEVGGNAIGAASVSVLVGSMQAKNQEVRKAAVRILGAAIRDEAERKSTALKETYLAVMDRDKNEKAIMEILIQAMEATDADRQALQEAAPYLLAPLGTRAKAAVPALLEAALRTTDVKASAEAALEAIKPTAAERQAALLHIVKNEESYSRSAAAHKLAAMGAKARYAVPELLTEIKKPLREPNAAHDRRWLTSERMALIDAYVKIAGDSEALPIVTELLDKNHLP